MSLVHAFALTVFLAACSKRMSPEEAKRLTDAMEASAPKPPPPKLSAEQVKAALEGHGAWTASTAKCPVALVAAPPPEPGVDLGQAALNRGTLVGQPNTKLVKSLAGVTSLPGAGHEGEKVPVLYVESERVEPVLDTGGQSFTAGYSKGTAYVFDHASGKFACMASVEAHSSPVVTTMNAKDGYARMWIAMDLLAAIDRAVVANAHAIAIDATKH